MSTSLASAFVDEVQQGHQDACGWSLVLWLRLERLRGRVDGIMEGGTDG